jgi:hypothetical protein
MTGFLTKQIRECEEQIARLDRESIEVLHDIKNHARYLRDNRLNTVEGKDDSRKIRLNRDLALQQGIAAGGDCYLHCVNFKAKYKEMIKGFKEDEVEIHKRLEEGIKRALQ